MSHQSTEQIPQQSNRYAYSRTPSDLSTKSLAHNSSQPACAPSAHGGCSEPRDTLHSLLPAFLDVGEVPQYRPLVACKPRTSHHCNSATCSTTVLYNMHNFGDPNSASRSWGSDHTPLNLSRQLQTVVLPYSFPIPSYSLLSSHCPALCQLPCQATLVADGVKIKIHCTG